MEEIAALVILLTVLAYVVSRALIVWSLRKTPTRQSKHPATPEMQHADQGEEGDLHLLKKGSKEGENGVDRGDA
jgi:hypothetical protein